MTERCPYFVSGCRCGLHARHRGVCQVVEDWQPKRDSTPPATPVEPPEHGWCDVCPICGGHPHCPDHGDRRASHPPAVSGEGERLKKFREHLVNYQQGTKQRGTGAYSRGEIVGVQGTLAVLLGEFDQLFPEVRASTPTPGAPQ